MPQFNANVSFHSFKKKTLHNLHHVCMIVNANLNVLIS